MSELRKLDGGDLRKLNKSTVDLMRVLFARRGPAGPEFEAELDWLANKVGVSRATAERSLKRLRDAGVVTTKRVVAEVEHAGGFVRQAQMNCYDVRGEYRVRKGAESFLVPRVEFESWALNRKTQGRPRKAPHLFLPDGRKKVRGRSLRSEQNRPPPNDQKVSHSTEQGLKGEGSNIEKERDFLKSPPLGGEFQKSQRTAQAESLSVSKFPRAPKLQGRHPLRVRRAQVLRWESEIPSPKIHDEPGPKTIEDFFAMMAASPPAPRREYVHRIPWIPRPDIPQREYVGNPVLSPDMTERQLVTAMLHGFRAAHQIVFNAPNHAYGRVGSILRSKFYPRLLKAAKVLVEKEIAPQSWAEWRMKYYAKNGKKCPPMHVIFGEKMISTKSGWFRKDYDGVTYQTIVTDLNREQLYRTKEAHRINRGMSQFTGLPKWYVEMRRDEIKNGADSPIQRYPRLRKKGGSSRDYISTVSRSHR